MSITDLLPHLAGLTDGPPAPVPWRNGPREARTAAVHILRPRVRRLLAAECARVVLPLHESRCPGDTRPRTAVDTAVRFALGLATRAELDAAGGASSAAERAASTYAATYAANAANAAANAAADAAADAAYYAADAAYYAAHAAAHTTAHTTAHATYVAYTAHAAQWRWTHLAYTAALGDGVVWRPDWRTDTARTLARDIALTADFAAAPILADALQDAGCELHDILDRLRGRTPGAVLTRADVAFWQTLELTGEELLEDTVARM